VALPPPVFPLLFRGAVAAKRFPALANGLLFVPALRSPPAVNAIHDVALMLDRERESREASPT
jgi:hypothetical protein